MWRVPFRADTGCSNAAAPCATPALEREVFGVRFRNPVGIAAGFDCDAEVCRELEAMGFGFVETGTVTPRPQPGNPRPRIFRLPKDGALINRVGLANRGLEYMIRRLRRPHGDTIVGCNIGKNPATAPENAGADYLKLFRNLYQYADYFTVNISCGNGECESTTHTRASTSCACSNRCSTSGADRTSTAQSC